MSTNMKIVDVKANKISLVIFVIWKPCDNLQEVVSRNFVLIDDRIQTKWQRDIVNSKKYEPVEVIWNNHGNVQYSV